jgi:hypothetical protein
MEWKWPKTIGDRDRINQYDSYVKPLSAEEKILLTQRAHAKTQKELNKAIKNLEHAITNYFKAQYGANNVIGILDDQRNEMMKLKEDIKKLTLNALPYKELNLEREQEKTFMLPIKKISYKTIISIMVLLSNLLIYSFAYAFIIEWLYVIGFFLSVGIILSYFFIWSRNIEKTLPNSRKIGPKVW